MIGIVEYISGFVTYPVILTGLALYTFIFGLSILFSAPKPWTNPFKHDRRKPTKPLVTDQAARDRVIKQGFAVKKIPEKLDAIVVGSGIGGLSVATILSRVSKRVLVLEQHDQAGGCCHTYEEDGFEFDVGIHYVGEMKNNTVIRLLTEQLTEGQLIWEHLDTEFDFCAIGEPGKQKLYPFHAGGYDAWRKSMVKQFPSEEKAIDKYIKYIKEVRKETLGMIMMKFMSKWYGRILINLGLLSWFTKYFNYASRTTKEVLDKLTDNDDLKTVLSYNFGDYGTLPKDSSFAMHAALVNHMIFGASYPRGGASEIAFHLIPQIESAGGRVLVRAPVTRIHVENGKTVGVAVKKGEEEIAIQCPLVISDAGVANTFQSLLPKEVAANSSITRLLGRDIESGVGAMSLFVGLRGTAEELGLNGHNFWSYTGSHISEMAEDYLSRPAEEAADLDIPLLFISFPSAKDPTYNDRHPGKSVCAVVTLAKWEWFSEWEQERVKKRGQDYDSIKNAIAKRIWEQTLGLFPHLADKVEYFEIGSPVTNRFYLGAARGEMYGLDHSVRRFGNPEVVMNLRPETDIPGLMLTGQDVTNCGFAGALFGGLVCASKIMNRNLYDDLVKLRAEIKKSK